MATKKASKATASSSKPKKKPQKKASSSAKKPVTDATTIKKGKALDGYVTVGTVTGACLYAGIDRMTWYRWLEADPAFVDHVANAKEQVADRLEGAAIARATAWMEPSDTLLIFLLKGLRRDVYGEKREISGPEGGPIEVSPVEKLNSQLDAIAVRREATQDNEQPDGKGS